jgi:hypothetical protein
MDETVLIAKAQMRVLCRAAGLSPDTFERQFEAVFDAPPESKAGAQPQPRGPSPGTVTAPKQPVGS